MEDEENTAQCEGSDEHHLYPPALLNPSWFKHLFERTDRRLITRSSDLKLRHVILRPESQILSGWEKRVECGNWSLPAHFLQYQCAFMQDI